MAPEPAFKSLHLTLLEIRLSGEFSPQGALVKVSGLGRQTRRERRVGAQFSEPQAENGVTAEISGVSHGSLLLTTAENRQENNSTP